MARCRSPAGSRWRRLRTYATSFPTLLSSILRRLELSESLSACGAKHGGHGNYLSKLRVGVKHGGKVVRALTVSALALPAERADELALVTEVKSEAELESVELWRQGDATLYTKDNLSARAKLRYDPRVTQALQLFWVTAQYTVQRDANDMHADTLHREGHEAMMRRVYKVMIEVYDEAEATKTIAEDWLSDTKGADSLNREAFCNSLFELCDTWTAGISAYEYAAFLSKLFDLVTDRATHCPTPRALGAQCAPLRPPHAPCAPQVTVTEEVRDEATGEVRSVNCLWKPMADCHFDAETFGDGDETDDGEEAEREAEKTKKKGRGTSRKAAQSAVKRSQEPRSSASHIQSKQRSKLAKHASSKRAMAATKVTASARGAVARRKARDATAGASSAGGADAAAAAAAAAPLPLPFGLARGAAGSGP